MRERSQGPRTLDIRSIAPATHARPIEFPTGADFVDLPKGSTVYVGVTGSLKVLAEKDMEPVVFQLAPVGLLPLRVRRVYADETTATNLFALF